MDIFLEVYNNLVIKRIQFLVNFAATLEKKRKIATKQCFIDDIEWPLSRCEEGAQSDHEGVRSDQDGAQSDQDGAQSDHEGARSDHEGARNDEMMVFYASFVHIA